MSDEIKIKLRKVLGSKTPFYQGGWRMVLPKHIVRKYDKEGFDFDELPFIFLDTNKGVLMVPLHEFIKNPEMRGLYYAPFSGMSLEEISKLIDEMVQEDEA